MEVQQLNFLMVICNNYILNISYTGDYANDLKDGPGVYKHINGNIFEGYYKNGIRNGEGILTDTENG